MFLLKRFSFLSIHRIYFIEILREIYMKKGVARRCGTVGSIMNITKNQYKKGTQSTQLTQSTCHTCIDNSIYFFFFLSCREKSHDSNKSSREISKSHSQNLVLFNKI